MKKLPLALAALTILTTDAAVVSPTFATEAVNVGNYEELPFKIVRVNPERNIITIEVSDIPINIRQGIFTITALGAERTDEELADAAFLTRKITTFTSENTIRMYNGQYNVLGLYSPGVVDIPGEWMSGRLNDNLTGVLYYAGQVGSTTVTKATGKIDYSSCVNSRAYQWALAAMNSEDGDFLDCRAEENPDGEGYHYWPYLNRVRLDEVMDEGDGNEPGDDDEGGDEGGSEGGDTGEGTGNGDVGEGGDISEGGGGEIESGDSDEGGEDGGDGGGESGENDGEEANNEKGGNTEVVEPATGMGEPQVANVVKNTETVVSVSGNGGVGSNVGAVAVARRGSVMTDGTTVRVGVGEGGQVDGVSVHNDSGEVGSAEVVESPEQTDNSGGSDDSGDEVAVPVLGGPECEENWFARLAGWIVAGVSWVGCGVWFLLARRKKDEPEE